MSYQFIQPRTSTGILCPFTKFGKAQEDVASQLLLGSIQLVIEHALGGLCDRPAHAARSAVTVQGKGASAAMFPGGK